MTWATEAQLPKQVSGSITFKKINFTPPLKMGETTYQGTKRAFGPLQWAQTQNFLKNSHKGGVKNDELTPKIWKRGRTTKQKGRPLGRTSKEDTKNHLDIP